VLPNKPVEPPAVVLVALLFCPKKLGEDVPPFVPAPNALGLAMMADGIRAVFTGDVLGL